MKITFANPSTGMLSRRYITVSLHKIIVPYIGSYVTSS
jgi:hypothetical protein